MTTNNAVTTNPNPTRVRDVLRLWTLSKERANDVLKREIGELIELPELFDDFVSVAWNNYVNAKHPDYSTESSVIDSMEIREFGEYMVSNFDSPWEFAQTVEQSNIGSWDDKFYTYHANDCGFDTYSSINDEKCPIVKSVLIEHIINNLEIYVAMLANIVLPEYPKFKV